MASKKKTSRTGKPKSIFRRVLRKLGWYHPSERGLYWRPEGAKRHYGRKPA